MKNFARTIPGVLRQRGRFSTSHAETLGIIEDTLADHYELESAQSERESQAAGFSSDSTDGSGRLSPAVLA